MPLSRGDAKELKRSKRRGYEQIFRGHLIPAFGRQSSEPRAAGILPPARGVALFLEFRGSTQQVRLPHGSSGLSPSADDREADPKRDVQIVIRCADSNPTLLVAG